jgi:histone H3/H4
MENGTNANVAHASASHNTNGTAPKPTKSRAAKGKAPAAAPEHEEVEATEEQPRKTTRRASLASPRGGKDADPKPKASPRKGSTANAPLRASAGKKDAEAEEEPAPKKVAQPKEKVEMGDPVINAKINRARVRRRMDNLGINEVLSSKMEQERKELEEYRKAQNALKNKTVIEEVTVQGEDGKEHKEHRKRDLTHEDKIKFEKIIKAQEEHALEHKIKLAALSQARTRFSNSAATAVAEVFQETLNELVHFAAVNMQKAEGSKLLVSHFFEEGVEQLPLYPLYSITPVWKETQAAELERLHNAQLRETVGQVIRDTEKHIRTARKLGRKKLVDDTPDEYVPALPKNKRDTTKKGKKSTSFEQFIKKSTHALKEVKGMEKFKLASETKDFLDALLCDMSLCFSTMLQQIAEHPKSKTIKIVAVKLMLGILLTMGYRPVEHVEFVPTPVPDPRIVEQERKKQAEVAKKIKAGELPADQKYTIDISKIPKIQGWSVDRSYTYPDTPIERLYKVIDDALAKEKDSTPSRSGAKKGDDESDESDAEHDDQEE